jgi:hypothetical protein
MIQTDKILFIENPRTASTAIGELLVSYCKVGQITPRHGNVRDNIFEGNDPDMEGSGLKSFTVVRNPYDRMVSFWKEDHNELPFAEWFSRKPIALDFIPQVYYAESVDLIIKYENIHEEFNALMDSVGYDITLPVHLRKAPPSLSATDKTLVFDMFKEDFTTFGYVGAEVKEAPKKKAGRPKKKMEIEDEK